MATPTKLALSGTLRQSMVSGQIAPQGVIDERVLAAMLAVQRELFVPEERVAFAYADVEHRLSTPAQCRIMPQASVTGQLIQAACPTSDETVLDVGCLLGYSSAVLSFLSANVRAVESDPLLFGQAVRRLHSFSNVSVRDASLRTGIRRRDGDGWDVVILEGAAELFPHSLFSLVREGGRLVTGIISGGATEVVVYLKCDGHPSVQQQHRCALPRLGEFARTEEFVL